LPRWPPKIAVPSKARSRAFVNSSLGSARKRIPLLLEGSSCWAQAFVLCVVVSWVVLSLGLSLVMKLMMHRDTKHHARHSTPKCIRRIYLETEHTKRRSHTYTKASLTATTKTLPASLSFAELM
jgi:hypothetical protein